MHKKNNFVISTQHLSRHYESYIKSEGLWSSVKGFWNRQHKISKALTDVNLEIEPGQIIGLVGSNGAGKTTLLKLLSGLIHPSEGTAQVLGYTPWERKTDFLKQISILLGQKNQLWWDIPPLDSFHLLIQIYELDETQAKKRIYDLAERLQCTHVLKTQLRRLSLGERMKMEIIGSLLHEPQVLFLDEPTIGLDIVAQSTIRDFLFEYVKNKKPTIILTSHYMDDISLLADQLLLISQGQIVYNGSVDDFTKKSEQIQRLSFLLSKSEDLDQNVSPLLLGKYTLSTSGIEQTLEVPPSDLGPLVTEISKRGTILNLKIEETNFEDVIRKFLQSEKR
ncbi:MAG TPA: ATP-binding cassette domain-containing protein [Pseudobdellovibrionaceae bacterium]|nr:ATP-binding cassette domain-containing protein [Pseudobdellovibrionaceae bacterium]